MSSISPDIVTNGLVFCVDAADKKSYSGSGDTWYDRSGNDNNGTLENDPTFSTDGGGCIVFDGVDDFVNCGDDASVNIAGSITVEAWVNLTTTPAAAAAVIVTKGNVHGGATTVQYHLNFTTSRTVRLSISDGSTVNSMTTTATVNTGTWAHIVGIHDAPNTNSYIYINGELALTDTSSIGNLGATAIDLTIGYDEYTTRYPIDGDISSVRIYNRNISVAEVLQNYNAMKSRFGIT